jgi:hypothetical protein
LAAHLRENLKNLGLKRIAKPALTLSDILNQPEENHTEHGEKANCEV